MRCRKSNGRRVYHAAAKRELVRRCLEPGVSVTGIALAHGINAQPAAQVDRDSDVWIARDSDAGAAAGEDPCRAVAGAFE